MGTTGSISAPSKVDGDKAEFGESLVPQESPCPKEAISLLQQRMRSPGRAQRVAYWQTLGVSHHRYVSGMPNQVYFFL